MISAEDKNEKNLKIFTCMTSLYSKQTVGEYDTVALNIDNPWCCRTGRLGCLQPPSPKQNLSPQFCLRGGSGSIQARMALIIIHNERNLNKIKSESFLNISLQNLAYCMFKS